MKKNHWRTEYGLAFTGSGDIYGYVVNFEYSRQVSDRLFLAPSFGLLNFRSVSNSLSKYANAKSIEIASYFRPIDKGVFNLELGLGVFIRNWNWDYTTGPNTSFATDDFQLDNSSTGTQKYNTIGYTISLGAIFNLGETLSISTRLVLQNDTEGDIVTTARPGLIIKF